MPRCGGSMWSGSQPVLLRVNLLFDHHSPCSAAHVCGPAELCCVAVQDLLLQQPAQLGGAAGVAAEPLHTYPGCSCTRQHPTCSSRCSRQLDVLWAAADAASQLAPPGPLAAAAAAVPASHAAAAGSYRASVWATAPLGSARV